VHRRKYIDLIDDSLGIGFLVVKYLGDHSRGLADIFLPFVFYNHPVWLLSRGILEIKNPLLYDGFE